MCAWTVFEFWFSQVVLVRENAVMGEEEKGAKQASFLFRCFGERRGKSLCGVQQLQINPSWQNVKPSIFLLNPSLAHKITSYLPMTMMSLDHNPN